MDNGRARLRARGTLSVGCALAWNRHTTVIRAGDEAAPLPGPRLLCKRIAARWGLRWIVAAALGTNTVPYRTGRRASIRVELCSQQQHLMINLRQTGLIFDTRGYFFATYGEKSHIHHICIQSLSCQYVGEIEWVTESVIVATLGEACHIL
jgi:hypothetical protein